MARCFDCLLSPHTLLCFGGCLLALLPESLEALKDSASLSLYSLGGRVGFDFHLSQDIQVLMKQHFRSQPNEVVGSPIS